MFSVDVGVSTGEVSVVTSKKGGLSVEQIVELAKDKIIYVSDDAPEPIRQQAQAFSDRLTYVLSQHILLAMREERATICQKLRDAGHHEMADYIRRL